MNLSTRRVLVNLSNHSYKHWQKNQLEAARYYGEIVDLPFPKVDAHANEEEIKLLAIDYFNKIKEIGSAEKITVHIMGEMTLTFLLISMLQQARYNCIASTTEREVVEDVNFGLKMGQFNFVQFRKYM